MAVELCNNYITHYIRRTGHARFRRGPADDQVKQCISTDSQFFSESKPAMKCYSSAKPPLPSSHRKRCREIKLVSGDQLRSHGCHCSQKRKKIEITRRIRINKGCSSTSIPSDMYCWKKYEQKLIKGSSSRGGYYKCSSCTGCSARKHVIKDKNDPMVLIVTYKGEHNHHFPKNSTKLNGGDLGRILVKST